MAADSKREKVLVYLEKKLHDLAAMSGVQRRLPWEDELDAIPASSFPFAAIVGGMPQVEDGAGFTLFSLPVAIVVYVSNATQGEDDTDTRISDLADEVWRLIWEDTTCGGVALPDRADGTRGVTDANFHPAVLVSDRYAGFRLEFRVLYEQGDVGGVPTRI